MAYYQVIGYGDKKEYEMSGEVMFLVGRNEEFDKEVSQEDNANPELDFHELRHFIKRFVVECVYGNAYHKEN